MYITTFILGGNHLSSCEDLSPPSLLLVQPILHMQLTDGNHDNGGDASAGLNHDNINFGVGGKYHGLFHWARRGYVSNNLNDAEDV